MTCDYSCTVCVCVWCSVYDAYSFHVIPVMGQVIAGDWKSYQYLVESIRQFPSQASDLTQWLYIAVDQLSSGMCMML